MQMQVYRLDEDAAALVKPSGDDPYKALWAAVVRQAIADYWVEMRNDTPGPAYHWLFGRGRMFGWVADHLNLDVDLVRSRLHPRYAPPRRKRNTDESEC